MYTNAWSLYADLTSQNRSNQDGTIIFLLREADASYMYTYVLQRFFVVVVVVVLLFLLFFSPSSVLLYVDRDHTDYQGRGAQDVLLDFHTAPEL